MSIARYMQMAAAGGAESLFGPAYGDWDGSPIRFSGFSDGNSGTDSQYNSLGGFYDKQRGRLYAPYTTPTTHTGSYPFFNAGSSFIPNWPTSSSSDCTVAYQNGASYVCFSVFNSNEIYVYTNDTTMVYKGYFWLGSVVNGRSFCFGYWNGNPVIFSSSNSTTMSYHTLPDLENLSGNTVSRLGTFNLPSNQPPSYNLFYAGRDATTTRVYFYYRQYTTAVRRVSILDNSSSNGVALSETAGAFNRNGTSSYGIFIDYELKKLYIGGYTGQILYRYPSF
jgi:hypothetical protein